MFRFLRMAANCACAAAVCVFMSAAGTETAFPAGEEYTFYRFSASSQAEIVRCKPAYAAIYKYFLSDSLTGESTVYSAGAVNVEELLQTYSAAILFTETVCGVENYYCYSQVLEGGVLVNGCLVNLHVAREENGERTAVGTPLLFGGF